MDTIHFVFVNGPLNDATLETAFDKVQGWGNGTITIEYGEAKNKPLKAEYKLSKSPGPNETIVCKFVK